MDFPIKWLVGVAKTQKEPIPGLGDRIRQCRKAGGWSNQTEFAEALGCDKNTVSLWETGEHNPDSFYLLKMSKLFNKSADWLLGLPSLTLEEQAAADLARDLPPLARKKWLEIGTGLGEILSERAAP
jgi:transcriptional regulator with XRE-family HTH domain